MSLTREDAQALTYLATRLRQDTYGCGKWDQAGTFAVIAELRGQSLTEVLHRVIGHALDPEARTPGAIRRPFVPKPVDEPGRRQPAKAGQDCKRHPGEYVGSCRGCAVDFIDHPQDPVLADQDRSAGQALRDQIRARRQATKPTLGLTEYGKALLASADDRPETACAAPGCFRPTRDGICDRCRATAAAEDVDAANAELIDRLKAQQLERAHTRPDPDPGPPRYFTSADYDPDRVHAAQARALTERSTT